MKTLFDSRNVDKLYEDVRRYMKERFTGEPEEKQIWDEVFELQDCDHQNVVGRVEDADLKLIFYGKLGLWNGKVYAYTIRRSDIAFYGSREAQDILIECDDKDVWFTEFHHDGRNVMRVRALKEPDDVKDSQDRKFLQNLLAQEIYLKEKDEPRVERVSSSILPYFKEEKYEEA